MRVGPSVYNPPLLFFNPFARILFLFQRPLEIALPLWNLPWARLHFPLPEEIILPFCVSTGLQSLATVKLPMHWTPHTQRPGLLPFRTFPLCGPASLPVSPTGLCLPHLCRPSTLLCAWPIVVSKGNGDSCSVIWKSFETDLPAFIIWVPTNNVPVGDSGLYNHFPILNLFKETLIKQYSVKGYLRIWASHDLPKILITFRAFPLYWLLRSFNSSHYVNIRHSLYLSRPQFIPLSNEMFVSDQWLLIRSIGSTGVIKGNKNNSQASSNILKS